MSSEPVRTRRTAGDKFALPHEQPGIIVRQRLLQALDAGIERSLTLLSAPPGSGKTALLGSWVASAGAPSSVAWLSSAAERVPPERHERFAVSVAALRMHLARLRGDLDGAVELGRSAAE